MYKNINMVIFIKQKHQLLNGTRDQNTHTYTHMYTHAWKEGIKILIVIIFKKWIIARFIFLPMLVCISTVDINSFCSKKHVILF